MNVTIENVAKASFKGDLTKAITPTHIIQFAEYHTIRKARRPALYAACEELGIETSHFAGKADAKAALWEHFGLEAPAKKQKAETPTPTESKKTEAKAKPKARRKAKPKPEPEPEHAPAKTKTKTVETVKPCGDEMGDAFALSIWSCRTNKQLESEASEWGFEVEGEGTIREKKLALLAAWGEENGFEYEFETETVEVETPTPEPAPAPHTLAQDDSEADESDPPLKGLEDLVARQGKGVKVAKAKIKVREHKAGIKVYALGYYNADGSAHIWEEMPKNKGKEKALEALKARSKDLPSKAAGLLLVS